MKKTSLLFVLILFLFFGGKILLRDSFIVKEPVEQEDANEENEARAAYELKMLADPATGKIPEGIQYKELAFLKDFNKEYGNLRGTRGTQEWTSRGPWNVGGRTRAICIDCKNSNHIIAGAVSGGLWQSFDAGTTWKKVTAPNDHPGVVSISQDTRAGKTNFWYALSGEITGTSASGGDSFYLGDGAFISSDNGTTWTPLASTAGGFPNSFSTTYQGAWRIVAAAVDSVPTCIYMALYGGISRSIDTGKTWKNVIGSGTGYYTDVTVSSKGIVYASISTDGTTKGFFRSGDGVHFTNITPAFIKKADRTVIGINPNNEDEIYFLSKLPDSISGGVVSSNFQGDKEYVALSKYKYLSGDGSGTGGEWTNLSTNLPVYSPAQFDKFNVQGGYDLMVKVQPITNAVIIGGTNMYISTDGFTSINHTTQIGGYGIGTMLYNFVTYPNHHPDQHDIIFVPNHPGQAYSVSDGGVRFTNNINANPVEWINKNLGYTTSQFYTVSIDESKAFDQYILGGLQDNANYITYSNDRKANWQLTINGDGAYNYIAPNRDFYVMSTQQGNMRKVILNDKGFVTSKRRIDPAGVDRSSYGFINPFVVDPNDNNFIYMPISKQIVRLSNLATLPVTNDTSHLANGWIKLGDTINTAKLSDGTQPEITALQISKSPANMLYFGTSNRELYRIDNANSSNPIMKKLSVNRLPAGGYVSDIAIDPDSAQNVFICFSNYNVSSLFYSRDTGNTWYYVGGNLESSLNNTGSDPSVRCVTILVDKQNKRHYFAGTSIGLFSADSLILAVTSGTNKTIWKQESPDVIGASVVTDIQVRRSDGYVVVATHGFGIFESYYTGEEVPDNEYGYTTDLYPNPVQDQFTFTFNSIADVKVHADIIDMMGNKVMSIVDGFYKTGTHIIQVNTSHLANGHYFTSFYAKGADLFTSFNISGASEYRVNRFVVNH